jgi:hypothetical protein
LFIAHFKKAVINVYTNVFYTNAHIIV